MPAGHGTRADRRSVIRPVIRSVIRSVITAGAGALILAATASATGASAATDPTGPVVAHGAAQPVFSPNLRDWVLQEAWVEVPVDSDRDGVRDRVHVRYARARAATDRLPTIMVASPYFAGIRPQDVGRHDVFIPFRGMVVAVESAAIATATTDFGRQLAQRQGIEILGPVGVAARTAATVAEAFAIFENFMAAYSPAISATFTPLDDPGRAFFEFRVLVDGLPPIPQSI